MSDPTTRDASKECGRFCIWHGASPVAGEYDCLLDRRGLGTCPYGSLEDARGMINGIPNCRMVEAIDPPSLDPPMEARASQDSPGPDMIHCPPHYTCTDVEPLDVIEAWGLGYRLGNVIKYIGRHQHKGSPLADLQKGMFYLEREILILEQEEQEQDAMLERAAGKGPTEFNHPRTSGASEGKGE